MNVFIKRSIQLRRKKFNNVYGINIIISIAKLVRMKTIKLSTDPINPTKIKAQYNLNRPKMFASNYKNMQLIELNKISEIIRKNNFRDSRNIFLLKINQNQRYKNKSTILPIVQNSLHKHKQQISSSLSVQEVPHGQLVPKRSKHVNENQQIQNYDQCLITEQLNRKQQDYYSQRKYVKNPEYYQKTLFIYKKKSLNSDLNFFKVNDQHQKSKTIDNSNCFNAELIGHQKRFSKKISSIPKSKRKKQMKSKQQLPGIQIQNHFHLQSIRSTFLRCTSHEKCPKKQRILIERKRIQTRPKMQKLFRHRQTLQMISTIKLRPKPIQQIFTPWRVPQQLENYHYN